MPHGLPPRRAMRLLDRGLARLPFARATATFAEDDEEEDDGTWAEQFRAAAKAFRRFARTLDRVAELCDRAGR